MKIVNEHTGEILQSKIFISYTNDNGNPYYGYQKGSLNGFLKQNAEKIHSIIPLHVGDYGRILVLYYDKLEE